WGKVLPFSMPTSTAVHHTRNGVDYPMYYDPGMPPQLNLANGNDSSAQLLKWGHSMVLAWSSHLDANDTTTWDISPKGKGNIATYPTAIADVQAFYDFNNGFTQLGPGYSLNPVTGQPYTPQLIKRGDYTRIVSQYWADGPTSETPPGHWFTLLNSVSDYPGFQKQMGGVGPVCPDLEWDVKSYFTLGGAMHDAAISCWGIKGWYDSPRPISMIRKMAALGQCTSFMLPNYNPAGLALIPGFIEQVTMSDPAALRGVGNVNLNKIKVKTWKGFPSIIYNGTIPMNAAGVGWILAENWMPYQRETFVTPPFAGYTSGHSTFSRAGAICMTNLTGTPYFPGGLYEYTIPANSNFLVFEKSPTVQIKLQYATYLDASDEASASRIWGGIHPPFDDMPARHIGEQIGNKSYLKAKSYFDNEVVSIDIVSNLSNPICEGSTITYSASITNPPLNPVYTWKKNGIVMQSGSSDTYVLSNFVTSDKIVCEVSGGGYIVASNEITIQTTNCSLAALNLKLYLQGYYVAPNIMELALANQGVGSSGTLTDSIVVELHAAVPPYSMIETQTVALNSDGTASCLFSSGAGTYYIAIKHRNSLTTWSANPVTIGTSTAYDFTLSSSSAYGNNMIEVENGIWALYAGDIVADENIDLLDLSLLENDIYQFVSGYYSTDINGDGNVDLLDSPLIENNIASFIFSNHP
ncbi:MAG TPA: hypothetical protein PLU17_14095, partial [Chitinophagaceae bacterium]|nr:hypothetical protein [Chitinophagaceae bacterium]